MNQNERSNSVKTTAQKSPYQKPAFRFESVFETSALSCGKISGSQGPCRGQRKVS